MCVLAILEVVQAPGQLRLVPRALMDALAWG
jgi:hypothetical protein